jgi:predicted PhzF superfamily epimerase YddE/YHI9
VGSNDVATAWRRIFMPGCGMDFAGHPTPGAVVVAHAVDVGINPVTLASHAGGGRFAGGGHLVAHRAAVALLPCSAETDRLAVGRIFHVGLARRDYNRALVFAPCRLERSSR